MVNTLGFNGLTVSRGNPFKSLVKR